MNRIKTSLVALVLLLSVGVTVTVNANSKPQTTYCSSQPGGGGGIGTPAQFGCSSGAMTCCYRIPDSFVFQKP